MTILRMDRALVLLILPFLLVSCAEDAGPPAAAPEEVEAALEEARNAAADTAVLEDELDRFEARLARLQEGNKKRVDRLGRSVERLTASLADLRAALKDAEGSAGSALGRAETAAANAAAAARDIAVLEDRFNLHLSRNHGGG